MSWSDQMMITGHPGLSPSPTRTLFGEHALRLCARLRE
jgi:hypothetical protein